MNRSVGYFLSFVFGLSASFAIVFAIAKFFSDDRSDKSESGKDSLDI